MPLPAWPSAEIQAEATWLYEAVNVNMLFANKNTMKELIDDLLKC